MRRTHPRHARPGSPRRVSPLAGIPAVLLAVSAAVFLARSGVHHPAGSLRVVPRVPSPEVGGAQTQPRETRPWQAFARAKGITLFLPARHPVAVAYHEASVDFAATLRPLGHIVRNANRWKFDLPVPTSGPDYIVMSSRGRPMPATSAADIILRPRTPVRSPVTGRVIHVRPYNLYCRYPDMRVSIRPRRSQGFAVVLIHLTGVRVHEGQQVFARLSVLGFPRRFGFRSQVDDYVRGGNPHVHVEVAKPHPVRRTAC